MLYLGWIVALIIFLLSMWLLGCGGGKVSVKGKESLGIYHRVLEEDQQQFRFNAQKGVKHDSSLIQRLANNNPLQVLKPPKTTQQSSKLMSGNLSNFVKKKMLRSEYDDLIDEYKNSSDLWTDPDFPPNNKSWGYTNKPVQWKRVGELIPDAKFAQNSFSPEDIIQGNTNDCYFLCAIAGIAEKPYRIKKIFGSNQMNRNGIYMARLMHRGVYKEVVVDDYIPIDASDGSFSGAYPAGGNEIWVMILQKCWAKVCGSYEALDKGGSPDEVLRAFTSAPTYGYNISKALTAPDTSYNLQFLWNEVVKADKKEHIICCGTHKKQDLKSNQLVPSHAYTVLSAYDTPSRILKLRNPWGAQNTHESLQWNGRASEKDTIFWSQITANDKKKMGFGIKNDGVFFMLWEDFSKYFVLLCICKIEDNAHYFYHLQNFSRLQPKLFDVEAEGGKVTFVGTQKSPRDLLKEKETYANIALILARITEENSLEYIGSKSYSKASEVYLESNLTKGNYVLCCYVEGAQDEVKTTISCYAESNICFLRSSVNEEDFLNLTFLDHAAKNTYKHILSKDPLQWCLWEYLQECRFGYFAIHLDTKSTTKAGLSFDEADFQSLNLELFPFYGRGTFKVVCDIGYQLVIIFRSRPGSFVQKDQMRKTKNPIAYRLRPK